MSAPQRLRHLAPATRGPQTGRDVKDLKDPKDPKDPTDLEDRVDLKDLKDPKDRNGLKNPNELKQRKDPTILAYHQNLLNLLIILDLLTLSSL